MKKKLLYVVNDADYFVSHRIDLAKAAQQNSHEIFVATKDGSKNSAIVDAGFTCIDIPVQRGKSGIVTEIKTFHAIYKILKQYDFDIVHAITLKMTLWTGIAGRLTKQKHIIFALTGLGYIFTDNSLFLRLIRFVFIPLLIFAMNGKSYRSIFQNPDDKELFENYKIISKTHGTIIKGSGVDTQYYSPITSPSAPISILFSGRLLGHKGIHEYISAATIIKEKYPKTRFLIAGDFDFNNPSCIAKDEIERWVKDGIVTWLGHVGDVRDALKQCHIVCLPSYREGLPKSLIEAASCELPIVTTDIPGCREIVKNNENGFLVPVQSIEPLAAALEKLIVDKTLRKKFGQNGRKLVENELSITHVIEQTLMLYNTYK